MSPAVSCDRTVRVAVGGAQLPAGGLVPTLSGVPAGIPVTPVVCDRVGMIGTRTRRGVVVRAMLATGLVMAAVACGGDDDAAEPATTPATIAETTMTAPVTTTSEVATTTTTTEVTPTTTTEVAPTTTEPSVDRVCPAVDGALVGRSGAVPDDNDALIADLLERELGVFGVEVRAVNAEFSFDQQLADIEALVADGVEVLVVDPVPAAPVLDRLAELAAEGLAVITQGTVVGAPTTAVVFDAADATERSVERLADAVGDGPVAAVFGPMVIPDFVVQAEVFTTTAAVLGLTVSDTAIDESFVGVASPTILSGWAGSGVLADLAGIWTHQPASAFGLAEGSDVPAIVTLGMDAALADLMTEGRIVTAYDLPFDVLARGVAHAVVEALCDRPLPEIALVEAVEVDASTLAGWEPPAVRARSAGEVELMIEGDRAVYRLR